MRAEQLTDRVACHGEGPVWSPRWGGLRWVDMLSTGLVGAAGRPVMLVSANAAAPAPSGS
jgi:hypothetical protein